MDELFIIKKLAKSIDDRKYPFQMSNAFIYAWECDYWAMDSAGITREFEVKISRSDYFNDAKKDKHASEKGANYFYYVCPKNLIKKEEVDAKYGLIYIWETGHVEIVKKPRQRHTNKFDNWKMLANKTYWRFRQLWREKYIAEEITADEYFEGFNLSLVENEQVNEEDVNNKL